MKPLEKQIHLLDCTLRDSSYVINFQFTVRDVKNICEGLEKSGLGLIEVGHGLGLGASSVEHGISFEEDTEYIEAAVSARDKAKIGSFYIPGIGSKDDIKNAAKSGLDFIRIGVNATDINKDIDDVAFAKEQGLDVHFNLMKAYAVDEKTISESAALIKDWELESIYIVDSAGCMLPGQVASYIKAIKSACDTPAGFHGHNNLGLANANCLSAIEAGASFVDGTLRGMGRCTGNAQTEVLTPILETAGYKTGLDVFTLFETAEKFLTPLMPFPQGQAPIDIVIGMSKFHSGFLPRFKKVIATNEVDLNKLIMMVSKIDCVDPSVELIKSVADDLRRMET